MKRSPRQASFPQSHPCPVCWVPFFPALLLAFLQLEMEPLNALPLSPTRTPITHLLSVSPGALTRLIPVQRRTEMQGRATRLKAADERPGWQPILGEGKSPMTSPDSGSVEAAVGSAVGG